MGIYARPIAAADKVINNFWVRILCCVGAPPRSRRPSVLIITLLSLSGQALVDRETRKKRRKKEEEREEEEEVRGQ